MLDLSSQKGCEKISKANALKPFFQGQFILVSIKESLSFFYDLLQDILNVSKI